MSEKFLNLDERDYHMHCSNFSDWLSSIDEIVRFSWEIWTRVIAITDHSQFCIDYCNRTYWSNMGVSFRRTLWKWKNVINDVDVIFWVEGDIMDETGESCFNIQWVEPEFKILSAHKNVYKWTDESITYATIKAIEKYWDKIAFIAHPCNIWDFWQFIDIEKLVDCANSNWIPLEFNAKNFVQWRTNMEKLKYLLENSNQIYVNSDGHTLYELKEMRKKAIAFLKEQWYI